MGFVYCNNRLLPFEIQLFLKLNYYFNVFSALQLIQGECPVLEPGHRLSFACPILDGLMRGGLPLRGITELAGESAAGKTQFCLQLCLSVQYPRENGGLNSGKGFFLPNKINI